MLKPGFELSLAQGTKLVTTMLYFLQKRGAGPRGAGVVATTSLKVVVGAEFLEKLLP